MLVKQVSYFFSRDGSLTWNNRQQLGAGILNREDSIILSPVSLPQLGDEIQGISMKLLRRDR